MKKAVKVILILAVILLVLGIAAFYYIKSIMPSGDGSNDIVEGYYKNFQSDALLEMKYSQLGSFETAYTEFPSENANIGKVRVWYPKELEKGEKTWPMIMVVNASGTPAASYEPFFPRLASWGFIMVGNEDGQAGNGETASITLDFMLNIPADSVLSGKIDYDSMGIIGYSQGGAGAICAVTNYENGARYKAMFTGSAAYQTLAKNMGWEYDPAKIEIPYFMASSFSFGVRIIVPSSSMISQQTPHCCIPASRSRSTVASVCPFLTSTPPYLAISGNTWPGRRRHLAQSGK